MTGIVDYNAGNIRSVELALQHLGAEYRISKNPADLEGADRLIFPGVGEAAYAMKELAKTGFDTFLHSWAKAGKPLLGVCLGSQIIFEHSEEGDVDCLGLVSGRIRRFPADFAERGLKVPHMGWNELTFTNGGSALFRDLKDGAHAYFVHSYYIEPADPSIVTAVADYGFAVPAAIRSGNVQALQFHPEKSASDGLAMLAAFCSGAADA